MLIERTQNEVIIRLPSSVDSARLEQLVDFLAYEEATSGSKAKQKDIDKLAKEVTANWWKKNRGKFIKG